MKEDETKREDNLINVGEDQRRKREMKLKEINELRSANPLFDKYIWTIAETAEFLDLSVGTIYNLTSKKKIPFRKRRKRLYFIPREIHNWVQEGNEGDT